MAIALVKAGTVTRAAADIGPAYGQATTAGNALIAWVFSESGVSVTPPAGWTHIRASQFCWLFYKLNCGASEATPHFTCSGGNWMTGIVAEFSGVNAFSSGADEGGGNGTPQTVTEDAADSVSGALVIVATWITLTKAGTHTSTFTYNNGATNNNVTNNDATSTQNHYRAGYGFTTGNTVANDCDIASGSMYVNTINASIGSFTPAPTAQTITVNAATSASAAQTLATTTFGAVTVTTGAGAVTIAACAATATQSATTGAPSTAVAARAASATFGAVTVTTGCPTAASAPCAASAVVAAVTITTSAGTMAQAACAAVVVATLTVTTGCATAATAACAAASTLGALTVTTGAGSMVDAAQATTSTLGARTITTGCPSMVTVPLSLYVTLNAAGTSATANAKSVAAYMGSVISVGSVILAAAFGWDSGGTVSAMSISSDATTEWVWHPLGDAFSGGHGFALWYCVVPEGTLNVTTTVTMTDDGAAPEMGLSLWRCTGSGAGQTPLNAKPVLVSTTGTGTNPASGDTSVAETDHEWAFGYAMWADGAPTISSRTFTPTLGASGPTLNTTRTHAGMTSQRGPMAAATVEAFAVALDISLPWFAACVLVRPLLSVTLGALTVEVGCPAATTTAQATTAEIGALTVAAAAATTTVTAHPVTADIGAVTVDALAATVVLAAQTATSEGGAEPADYTIVQTKAFSDATSVTFDADAAAGSTLILVAARFTAGSGVTLSGGGTWSKEYDNAQNPRLVLGRCGNATGGATTVSFDTTPNLTGWLLEVTGLKNQSCTVAAGSSKQYPANQDIAQTTNVDGALLVGAGVNTNPVTNTPTLSITAGTVTDQVVLGPVSGLVAELYGHIAQNSGTTTLHIVGDTVGGGAYLLAKFDIAAVGGAQTVDVGCPSMVVAACATTVDVGALTVDAAAGSVTVAACAATVVEAAQTVDVGAPSATTAACATTVVAAAQTVDVGAPDAAVAASAAVVVVGGVTVDVATGLVTVAAQPVTVVASIVVNAAAPGATVAAEIATAEIGATITTTGAASCTIAAQPATVASVLTVDVGAAGASMVACSSVVVVAAQTVDVAAPGVVVTPGTATAGVGGVTVACASVAAVVDVATTTNLQAVAVNACALDIAPWPVEVVQPVTVDVAAPSMVAFAWSVTTGSAVVVETGAAVATVDAGAVTVDTGAVSADTAAATMTADPVAPVIDRGAIGADASAPAAQTGAWSVACGIGARTVDVVAPAAVTIPAPATALTGALPQEISAPVLTTAAWSTTIDVGAVVVNTTAVSLVVTAQPVTSTGAVVVDVSAVAMVVEAQPATADVYMPPQTVGVGAPSASTQPQACTVVVGAVTVPVAVVTLAITVQPVTGAAELTVAAPSMTADVCAVTAVAVLVRTVQSVSAVVHPAAASTSVGALTVDVNAAGMTMLALRVRLKGVPVDAVIALAPTGDATLTLAPARTDALALAVTGSADIDVAAVDDAGLSIDPGSRTALTAGPLPHVRKLVGSPILTMEPQEATPG